MKPTKEYANELINKYNAIGLQLRNEAIQCAIMDVTNTIYILNDIDWTEEVHLKRLYYNEVLTILKSYE